MTTHGFVSGRSGKKREIGFHCLEYFLDASSFQPWPNRTCIVAADSWIACVAGVERERGRGNLGAREGVWGARGGKERNLSFPFPRADCPILVKYQKICEGHLRFYLRSPRQMTQAGACILAGSEACPSKSSQLFPETGFYFFSSWRLCLCLVGGLFRLIIVFSWNLDMEYIIYLIEQTPHMGTGEKRRMAVGRALNQGWGRC